MDQISVKYKQLQRQQVQHLKDAKEEEKYVTDVRSKKLQFETSKRRKALAIKRKLEQAKEERRRQEILAKRREEINSATERYQRLNKSYTPKSDAEIKASLVTAVRTPDLDDALQIVRGSPRPSSPRPSSPSYGQQHHRQGSGGTIRSSVKGHQMMYSPNGNMYHNSHFYQQASDATQSPSQQFSGSNRTPTQNRMAPIYGTSTMGTQKQVQEKLHDHSLRNMTNSRSLFQQQLEQQQRNNAEHQHQSLHQFNSTLQKELSGSENRSPEMAIDRQSGSVTSMDSLEQSAATNAGRVETTQNNSRVVSSPSMYTNSSFGVHRSSNSPTVAVVQPSVVRRSPPETTDSRPYNKHNYDLKAESSSSDIQHDSLDGNYKSSSYGNRNEVSNLNNFLENYDNKQSTSPDSKSTYDGTVYQDVTVGYANGVDLSYAKPGYSDGYSVAPQNQRSSGWAIPSTSEISEAGKWKAHHGGYSNGNLNGASLVATSKPLHSSHTGQPAEKGYYLHTNSSQQVGSLPETNGFSSQSKSYAVKASQPGKAVENDHIYASSHYMTTNGATLAQNESLMSSTNPTGAVGNPSVPYYTTQSSGTTTSQPGVNSISTSAQPSIKRDRHQLYSATSNYDVKTNSPQQPLPETHTPGSAAQPSSSANGSYNASAYSTVGLSSIPLAQPVHVNHTMDSRNPEASVANTNNSNPLTGTNPSVVYSKNTGSTSSLNSRKPPLPTTQTTAAKPIAVAPTPNLQGNTDATPDRIDSSSNKSASSVNSRPTSGIPKPATSKPGILSHDVDPSKIPRPKNPSFGNKGALLHEERVPPDSSQSDEEEIRVDQQPNTHFMNKKVIKGILKKKPSSATLPRKPEIFGVRGEAHTKAGASQRSKSAHARVSGPRDSMEVTKEHKLNSIKRRKKKMVRFTDMTYTNDTETDTDDEGIEEEVEEYNVYQTGEMQKTTGTSIKKPPARPASAKVSHQSRQDSNTRGHRATGAVGPVGNKGASHQPHPPSEPPSGRAVMKLGQRSETQNVNHVTGTQSQQRDPSTIVASSSKGLMYSSGHDYMGANAPVYTTAANHNQMDRAQDKAVYDANGVRLDRTPTDDEINWLWDKVRTCLNREGSTVSNSSVHNGKKSEANQYNNNHPHGVRQSSQQQNHAGHKPPQQPGTQPMTTKYIDGNSLAPQFRTQTRISSAGTRQPGVRKINMDSLNNFSRRASLLNQRKMKDQTPTSIGYNHHHAHHQGENGGSKAVIQTSVKPLGYQQPVQSSNIPMHGGIQNGYNNDVSESMAAFLVAEQLAGQSVNENEIEAAMQEAQARQAAINNGHPSNKVPSAISLEEQRLMQSLERLNERLKVTETTDHHNIAHHGGFKGRVPLTSNNHPSKRFGGDGGFSRGQQNRNSSTGSMYRPTTAAQYRTSPYH